MRYPIFTTACAYLSGGNPKTRQSRRYAENRRDTAVFLEVSAPQAHFFKKSKKNVFIYSLGECVYQIAGFYRSGGETEMHTYIRADYENFLMPT